MKEFSYQITDAQGLHARPAGQLVRTASEYPCNVYISNGKTQRNAKRIFEVMSLGMKQGEIITLQTDGIQEDEAQKRLLEICRENL